MRKFFCLLGMLGLWMLALAGSAGAADVNPTPAFGTGWTHAGETVTITAGGTYTLQGYPPGATVVNQIIIDAGVNGTVTLTLDGSIFPLDLDAGHPGAGLTDQPALWNRSNAYLDLEIFGSVSMKGVGNAPGLRSVGDLAIFTPTSATLGVTGAAGATTGALYCDRALAVRSNVAVTATNTFEGHGVYSGGALSASGSLEGVGGTNGYGVLCRDAMTVTSGSVTGRAVGIQCRGVYSNGAMTVTNGSIIGSGKHWLGHGVHSVGAMTVTNGSITGSAEDQDACGVRSENAMTLAGGSITGTATGDAVNGQASGVYSLGAMTVTSGSVTGSAEGQNACGVYSNGTLTGSGAGRVTGTAIGLRGNGIQSNDAMGFSGTAQGTGTATNQGAGILCARSLTLAGQAVCQAIGPGAGVPQDTLRMTGGDIPLLRGAAPRLYVRNTSRDEDHQVDRELASTQMFLLGGNVASADPLTNQSIGVVFPQNSTGWVSVGLAPGPTVGPVPTVGPGVPVPPTGDGGNIGAYIALLCAAVGLSTFLEKRRKMSKT